MMDHEKQQKIQRLEAQFGPRFTHMSEQWNAPLVQMFREADPTYPDSLRPFWDATVALGRGAMQRVAASNNPSAIFICVPRGAYPLALGAAEQHPTAGVIVTDDGMQRTGGPLIPGDVPHQQVGSIFIVDSVLDQGVTLDRTLDALNGRIFADRIVMLTVIAHPPTVERVLRDYPTLGIITADIESRLVPAAVGQGFWLAGFGDIGGNVQSYTKLTKQPELMPPPGWYPDGLPIS